MTDGWRIRGLRCLIWGLALPACGGEFDGEARQESPFARELEGYAPTADTLSCGSYEDASGRVREEFYILSAIQRKLGRIDGLSEKIGVQEVSTCEEARRFMAAYAQESSDGDDSRDQRSRGAQHDEWEAGESLVRDKTQAIWQGQEVVSLPIVEINEICSATVVSPGHLLTAAHCIPSGGADVKIKWRTESGSYESAVFDAFYYRHEDYAGVGDFRDDIGLVSVHGFDWAQQMGHRMRIWTGMMDSGRDLGVYGYGVTDSESDDDGRLRSSQEDARAVVDAVDSMSFSVRGRDSRACLGDSGGPAVHETYLFDFVAGVTSEGQVSDLEDRCSDVSSTMRWTRPGAKIDWIEAKMSARGISCSHHGSNEATYARCW